MIHLFRELARREQAGIRIRVGIVGIGSMGRGIASAVRTTRGMYPALLVSRRIESALQTHIDLGTNPAEIVQSDDLATLDTAVQRGIPAVTSDAELACAIPSIEVIVESTGTVEFAAKVALAAIAHKKHLVVMNSELDSTVGCILAQKARAQGVVYTNSDGDQPAAMNRLVEWSRGIGFETIAAINCKGFLKRHSTPDELLPWAERMRTGAGMVCSFADGTKMNMENACLANGTGLIPEKRGMHGLTTNLRQCLADFEHTLKGRGVVDYTLGGDFGGGVLLIGRSEDCEFVGRYLDYLKMGPGPNYLFFRPYHLCAVETPVSIAEAVIYHEATLTPAGAPVADVIAVAKRDLRPGDLLDGIGGYTCYGEIDTCERAVGLLHMGLTSEVRVNSVIRKDEPIPIEAVDLDPGNPVVQLREEQDRLPRSMKRESQAEGGRMRRH